MADKRIFKYALIGPSCKLRLPLGSSIISALMQDTIVVYALVDPEAGQSPNHFHFNCFNTSNSVPKEIEQTYKFLATLQTNNGIVWHICYREVKGE